MCGFPTIWGTPPSKKSSKHKKSIRIHNSNGSHISISSFPGSLTINTSPPAPKPEPKPQPHPQIPSFPGHPTYTHTQATTIHTPPPHGQPYTPQYGLPPASQPWASQLLNPYQSQTSPHELQSKPDRHRRSAVFSEIDFVQSLSEKLNLKKIEAHAPKPEPQPSEMKKVLEEIQAWRSETKAAKQKEERAAELKQAREDGFKEGRDERGLERREEGYNGVYGGRGYESNRTVPDVATTLLMNVGMDALRSNLSPRHRSRSRSRSWDRYRGRDQSRDHPIPPIYIVHNGRRRRGSLEEIEDEVRRFQEQLSGSGSFRNAPRSREAGGAGRWP